VLWIDAKRVARRVRRDQVGGFRTSFGLELPAELGDANLQRLQTRLRSLPAPEFVEQAVGRHNPVRIEQQDREKRSLLSAWNPQVSISHLHLKRSQESKVQLDPARLLFVDRLERRKLGGQTLRDELEDVLGPRQVLETVRERRLARV
jgi:hypothetical protein